MRFPLYASSEPGERTFKTKLRHFNTAASFTKDTGIMSTRPTPVVKKSIYSWIYYKHLKLHALLVLIIFVTVFARVLPLEMQKRIVNEAINLRNAHLLITYCGIYLAAVLAASALKLLITAVQTLISQRVLSDMRIRLYDHILTLPLGFFRKTQPGMVVTALITEVVPSAEFIGRSIAVPFINILTLLAFTGYLLWLNPLLAVVSMSIYPVVLLLIPMLQKQVNRFNKKRVDVTRKLSSLIGETITGIHEVHGSGAYRIESRKHRKLVTRLRKIRIIWSLYTQSIKTANNLFNNLSPFLIFIIGGFLTMSGRLELGSLVAFLSAQEKLYDPWKELIEFYQVYQDASIRYRRTMEYFDADPEYSLQPADRSPYMLDGSLEINHLSFYTDSGIRLLDDISLSLKPGEHLALVGFSGSGKSTLAYCIGQLYPYSRGHVRIGDKEVAELTKMDMVQNTGFVPQAPFIFDGTILENLMYGCLARCDDPDECPFKPELDDLIEVLHQTGLFIDVLHFGLLTVLDANQVKELAAVLIRIRKNFQRDFGERLGEHVEFFDENNYMYYSDVAENLTFGTPVENVYFFDNLTRDARFLEFLDEADLTRPLLSLGSELSIRMVDILKNLPPDTLFYTNSPIKPDELDEYKHLAERLKHRKLHQLFQTDHQRLLAVALRYTPAIHRIVSFPKMMENLIIEGRALFREKIISTASDTFFPYTPTRYIESKNILNNILFGKLKTDSPQAREAINQSIVHLLIEENLLEKIIEIGMLYPVGSKGDNLSGGQKQKLAIARTLLKSPNLMIMDEATSALDNMSQARIQHLLETRWKGKCTLISIAHRLDIIRNYDKIAVMKAGKIIESGTYDELIQKQGVLYELVTGKR